MLIGYSFSHFFYTNVSFILTARFVNYNYDAIKNVQKCACLINYYLSLIHGFFSRL